MRLMLILVYVISFSHGKLLVQLLPNLFLHPCTYRTHFVILLANDNSSYAWENFVTKIKE